MNLRVGLSRVGVLCIWTALLTIEASAINPKPRPYTPKPYTLKALIPLET